MNIKILIAVSALVSALPASAQAQGIERGVTVGRDAVETTGGIRKSRFRSHHRSHARARSSYVDDGLVAGGVRSSSGVTHYEVASDFRPARNSSYTVLNEATVLVDGEHRIVEVLK